VTKFLLVVAGITLSTNAAFALDCKTFFTTYDMQRSCLRFVALTGEIRPGIQTTCAVLKTFIELNRHRAAITDEKKEYEACQRGFPDPPPPTPPTPTAYTRGLAALNDGNLDAAIAEFTTAISDDPKDTFSYIRRGTAYERKGDTASAIADYRKVQKLVDTDTGAEYVAKIRKLEKTKK
jgi:tetratricopeptide (TPR) repeat protein